MKKRTRFKILIAICFFLSLEGISYLYFNTLGASRGLINFQFNVISDNKKSWLTKTPRYIPHAYLAYQLNPEYTPPIDCTIDSYGLVHYKPFDINAPKSNDEYRVMTIGGSTTANVYPLYLQEFFDNANVSKSVHVINAGVPFYTTAESMMNFALRGISYKPDLIVVYHALNDTWPSCSEEFRIDYSHWRRQFIDLKLNLFDHMPRFFGYSATYVMLRHLLNAEESTWGINNGLNGISTYAHPRWQDNIFKGDDVFKRNMNSIIALARHNNCDVLLVTQALREHMKDVPDTDEQKLIIKNYYNACQHHNDITRDIAKENKDVYFYDFEAVIRPRVNELLRRDLCHFDKDGYKIMAEHIYNKITADIFK